MSPDAGNPLGQFLPLVFIFLIFYFIVFRPQQQKQKEHKKTVESLKKNDKVVTAGGIHGVVQTVREKTVVIRVDDNVKIEIDKESISSTEKSKEA